MLAYVAVFLGCVLVDLIPVMGPPAWIVMALMQVELTLDIRWVLLCGVTGSTLGRMLLARWLVPMLSTRYLDRAKNDDMQFLGKQLDRGGARSWLFVFLYTLTPIPTSPLFTAAGIANIRAWHLIPPFFLGKLVSDTVMVMAGKYSYKNAAAIAHGMVSWRALIGMTVGIVLIAAVLFVDWRAAIEKKQFRLRFSIWKH